MTDTDAPVTPDDGSASGRQTRAYLSLGEVLDALKDQFPDVTITKIRFFEGQGLLVPERTPSGYRKFYPADIERLRVILAEQEERFVPLTTARAAVHSDDIVVRSAPPGDGSDDGLHDESLDGVDLGSGRHPSQRTQTPSAAASRRATPEAPARSAASGNVAPLRRVSPRMTPAAGATPTEAPVPAAEVIPVPPVSVEPAAPASYSKAELITATGAPPELLDDAVRQGLIRGRSVFGATEFDEDDRLLLQALMTFSTSGLDPRHVRVFVHAAQREADLYVQATLPLLRRRPHLGVSADEPFRRFADLDGAGAVLRGVVVRRALQAALDGTPATPNH